MLPSSGCFKDVDCPYHDNGGCYRPYCHFKHVRRENSSTAPTLSNQTIEGNKNSETTTTSTTLATTKAITQTEIIQQLVSQAVTKVLSDQGVVVDTNQVSENIVSQVVEGLKPALKTTTTTIGKHSCVPQLITKPPCIYNPTPISELKKRHLLSLPAYNQIRNDNNKSSLKRKQDDDCNNEKTNELVYKPTAIINNDNNIIHDYIPTIKTDSINSSLFDDSNSSDYNNKRKETYCPKNKKRREEYVPKNIKTSLLNNQHLDDTMSIDDYNELKLYDNNIINNTVNITNKLNDNNDDSKLITKEVQNIKKTVINDDEKIINSNDDDVTKEITNNHSDSDKKNKEHHHHHHHKDHKDHHHHHHHSSSSSSNNNSNSNKERHLKEKKSDKKDSRERKHSTDKHKSSSTSSKTTSSSSSSRHKSKSSSHRDSSSSSHRHSKDKSSSSSRDKKSSSKENENHKSSSKNNDKYKSSSSSKSDKDKKSKSHKLSDKKSSKKHHNNSDLSHDDDDDDHNNDKKFINFEDMLISSESENDIEEECLKIFQEYQKIDNKNDNNIDEKKIINIDDLNEVEEIGKKRVAHPSASTNVLRIPGTSQEPKKIQNPQQKMYERWRLLRQAAAEKAAERAANNNDNSNQQVFKIESKNLHTEIQPTEIARMRIAHVPYAKSLALTKKKVIESATKPVEQKTTAQTARGTARVAHVPQTVPELIRPEPLQISTQKFNLNVRQYYVNMMQDICIQIYTNGDDAAQRALREEFGCHERCTALSVYKNSCMLAVHKLRKEVNQNNSGNVPPTTTTTASGMVSHDALITGKTKGSWSVVKNKKIITDFKGTALYCKLKKWIMSEQQLKDWGYPRIHPDGPKGRAKVYVINSRNKTILSKVPNERYCSRCNQSYMVDKHGLAVRQQNCIYHWGRKFTYRGEGKYSCCQQDGTASGCCDAKSHVWDVVDYESLYGYVQTLPKDKDPENQGVYALDCEMCYTSHGLELTRITVIDEDCNVVYETLVKPDNPIIDYNTRFSGITEKNMKGVTTSLRDVQAVLLTMLSEFTIVIGHSLDSDFKALKLIHNTIVDTSFMFPHKNGFPQKRALRNLCSEYLRKIIQNDVDGHDSKEDAVACMELIQWKVKEEAKLL
ncbi:hypothetical protein HCN44_008182 [Aphidius gifuensis]|uniref:Exonuclease domain-containing protein n=1 Tax=Aphidius gifuensis TaxID=684658 RepID=A0A835CPU5_APHGI|nr:RNA exonuclease 1 homolog [Aphidius gifuensis]KAF7989508.1 hypothetical protein HCN44_008182 [Aphidius gifuensis]